MNKIKYFSLFSGLGGFELGIGDKGVCVGYSEKDKYATEIYRKWFPKHRGFGDVTKIDTKSLPNFEMLVAGFPCPSFSTAGAGLGFKDKRGALFFEIIRVAREKQPRLLLLENVKGILSNQKGYTFFRILSEMDKLGYDLQWQVLNAKDFDLPQNRSRVFIIGHLRGSRRPEVFPLGTNDKRDDPPKRATSLCLTSRSERYDPTFETFIANALLSKHDPPSRTQRRKHENMIIEDRGLRRLTPLERERAQGFPDNWTLGLSDAQRDKCTGNAVPVNMVRAIISKLL